jgi:hypothetical protein
MTKKEKAIREFCGQHADWWPSTTQVQEMLALAQPEQEPVAWISQKSGFIAHNKPDQSLNPMPLYLAPPPCPTCEALARTVMLDQTSHDTTPPQRTWVGLTDKDCKGMGAGDKVVAMWADRTLKEKNT